MLTIAISGLRELNLDVSGVIKTVVLPVNGNDTVNLPDDYINYVRIGVCNTNDGDVRSLGYNPKMCLPRKFDDCGNFDRTVPADNQDRETFTGIWNGYDGGFYRNGEVIGRLFGLGGGNNRNGMYRIDKEMNLIVLQDPQDSEIVLEYLGDPRTIDGNHQVHGNIVEALKAWIYWKDIQRNRTYGVGDKEQARVDWVREKGKANRRFKHFNMDEAVASVRKSFKQAPKF
jgi:hypothetical protein